MLFRSWLEVPARIVNDRTLVPLRFVTESFGADVVWDGQTFTAYIYDYYTLLADVRANHPELYIAIMHTYQAEEVDVDTKMLLEMEGPDFGMGYLFDTNIKTSGSDMSMTAKINFSLIDTDISGEESIDFKLIKKDAYFYFYMDGEWEIAEERDIAEMQQLFGMGRVNQDSLKHMADATITRQEVWLGSSQAIKYIIEFSNSDLAELFNLFGDFGFGSIFDDLDFRHVTNIYVSPNQELLKEEVIFESRYDFGAGDWFAYLINVEVIYNSIGVPVTIEAPVF